MIASTSPRPKAADSRAAAAWFGPQAGSRPKPARRAACASPSATPAARAPTTPALRYISSRSANQVATSWTSAGSSRGSLPVATARSQPWTRWSAASWCRYSARPSSPYERCTGSSEGSVSRTTVVASAAAASEARIGSSPRRSPSSWCPTSSGVLPRISGTVQRSSPVTWFARSRTDQSRQGVGRSHCSGRTALTRSAQVSTLRW